MWRLIVLVDVRWQIPPVVWSITDARYIGIHYSQNIPCWMGRKIWSNRKSDDWPRTPVWIWNIPKIVATYAQQEHPHNSVPSPQANGETTPQLKCFPYVQNWPALNGWNTYHWYPWDFALRWRRSWTIRLQKLCMEPHHGYQHSISLTPNTKGYGYDILRRYTF